ncbi:MAG: AMP-binding protein [Burkholderiales bacterium]|nr:AMP-binding protein [Burkholderiales bacterium]
MDNDAHQMAANPPTQEAHKDAPVQPDAAAARLIDLIEAFLRESRPGRPVRVALDSTLERDLGIDSLGRVELLLRAEREFGVSMPERALSSVETPRDLLLVLISAHAPEKVAQKTVRELVVASDTQLPEQAQTLIEVLDWHAAQHPDQLQIHLYDEDEREHDLSYAELKAGAEAVAVGLVDGGLEPGQMVAIMLPTGRDYFFSFYGILIAGGIPVPIYPPLRLAQLEDHMRRHAGILANAQVAMMITMPEAKPVALLLRSQVQSLRGVMIPAEFRPGRKLELHPRIGPGDTAFLQYTSGSTGNPKGVVLTHANLLANIRAMGQAVAAAPSDVFVSWLPLYHDMGLIGAWLAGLYHGFPSVVMSPLAFLSRPQRWLWAIHRHRGTLSAAPNFAYELCLRKIEDADIEGLDLSSWRYAFNGAEPVNPDTIAAFRDRFAKYGLRAEAIAPVYGLAECTVGLAFPPPGRGPVIDRIQRDPFMSSGRAIPADEGERDVLRMVACGMPLPGHEVRVVDAAGFETGERQEGRLQFKGPSATSGYYRNPEQTRRLFAGEWLDSGDYAYLVGGEVYLSGRVKDMIIRGGRNIFPYDLEQAVGNLPGVRKGCVAVFGSADAASGTERLVVLAETRETGETAREQLRHRINEVAVDVLGMPVDDVVLAPPHTVLKTSSGKIRRAASREFYERGGRASRPAPVWWQVTRLMWTAALPQLRRGGRALADLVYGCYVLAWFALLAPLTWLAVALIARPQWCRPLIHYAARLFLWLARIRVTARGLENLPPAPCVLAANHTSYLDGIVLSAALPPQFRYAFAAKREFARQLIPRLFLRGIGAVYVERFDVRQGSEDVEQFAAVLRAGNYPVFFPEGTFDRRTGLRPFRSGAFAVAARAGVPVVPVAIRGARAVLRSEVWLPRRGAIAITFGLPLQSPGSDWEATVQLRDAVRGEILRAGGEPDLAE